MIVRSKLWKRKIKRDNRLHIIRIIFKTSVIVLPV